MRAPHGRARARQPRDAEPGGRQPPAHKGRHGALEAARPRRRADAGQAQAAAALQRRRQHHRVVPANHLARLRRAGALQTAG